MDLYRIPMTGGINLLSDPRNIRDDELVKSGNLVPVRPGVLQTRRAVGPVARDIVNMTSSHPMSAQFGPWVDSPLFFTTFGIGSPSSISLYAYTLDGVAAMSALTLFTYPDGTTDGSRPHSFQFAGRIYFLPGFHTASAPAYSIGRGETALTEFAFSGTGNGEIRPKLAANYRSRVVWAHFGVGYENTLVFSDNLAPATVGNDVLASNGRNVNLVRASDGDEIVAIVEVMLTAVGTPAESALLILRRFSAFLLTGEPDQTSGGTNSLAVNQMSVAAGCASPASVQVTPYGVFWAGMDEVWHFQSGQIPHPVGTKIRPALDNTPRNLGFRVSASYFDGFYRLCLFSDDQEQKVTEGVWDQYWLDLRGGAPQTHEDARWWGPVRYNYVINTPEDTGSAHDAGGTGITVRDDRPGGTKALYGVERNWNVDGGASFPIYGNIVKYDVDSSIDVTINTATGKLWTHDHTIKPDLITKEYDLGDPMLQKIYDGMEANVWASQSGRLLAEGILDDGLQYVDTNIDVVARGFAAGADAPVTTTGVVAPRAPQAVSAFDTSRSYGTTVQLRLQGQAGYIVDATNDEFAFEDYDGDAYYAGVAQLTRGFYTTLELLTDMLSAAMDTANGQPGHAISRATTGLLTFRAPDTSAVIMCFSNTAAGTTLGVTQAQRDKTAQIAALLGFNTGANISYAPYGTGDMAVWSYNAPVWEINGLGMRLEVIPRRPS